MVIAYVLGAELIIFSIIVLLVARWGKKLEKHLSTNHPKFLEENLSAPFWAGDWNVVMRHVRALRNAYWGLMPDATSSFYQSQLRRHAKYALLSLLVCFITLIIAAVISLALKGVLS